MADIPDTFTIRTRSSASTDKRTHNEIGVAHSKIAEATAPGKIKVFTSDSVRHIQDWRGQNNLTQKQLDQRCAFPANTMNGLEGRKVGPTSAQLQRLNALLKTGLSLE